MLECLFAGPALKISLGDAAAQGEADHLKSGCAGGLYKRLDLPGILRSMILRIPAEHRHNGAHWQSEELCPSFAGLGLAPSCPVAYRVEKRPDAARGVVLVVESKTPIGNLKTVMPNSEAAVIVGGRYHLLGTFEVDDKSWACVGGSLSVTEEISYVRPALGPAVLKKTCDTGVALTVRWDS